MDLQEAEDLASTLRSRGYSVDIGSCIGRSWELLIQQFWLVTGITTLMLLLSTASGFPAVILGETFSDDDSGLELMGSAMGFFVNLLIGGGVMGGLYWFFLRLIRSCAAGLNEAFAGFSAAYRQLTFAYVVTSLLTTAGLFLCLLPGIYLAVAWVFALPLVIDKELDFWEAMELSRKVVTANWWSVFLLLIVLTLLAGAGLLLCCIGLVVTVPLALGALMYAYEDIFCVGEKVPPLEIS